MNLPIDLAAGPWEIVASIVLATFISEDLTCIAVGLLIAAGRLDWLPGVAACFAGIVLGDFGVYLIGRAAGGSAQRWKWVRRKLPAERLSQMSQQLCRRAGRTIVISRFIPGTRVPLYLAAGLLGTCPYRFLTWGFAAALVWTPALIFAVVLLGESVSGWQLLPFAAAAFLATRVLPLLARHIGRAKLIAKVSRLWRWEFWPPWIFYLPLVPWFLWLSIRYRSFTVWTAANPGIEPAGGVVGESKFEILSRLPNEWIVPTVLIPEGDRGDRRQAALATVEANGWTYPLILKPDVGERGAGVKKVHDPIDLEKYLLENPAAVIIQPYHPGPFEAGIFYYRMPGDERGTIFSITDKVFPVVVGDGRATLEELIWSHPRYRMQGALFVKRHSGEVGRVLAMGDRFPLGMAGNHCQGALFRDGGHLVTPELIRSIDEIARRFEGFFIGRFDVRYRDAEQFLAGQDFAIVELNGVTSESTNLYDPSWPLWRAYRTLFRQWSMLFRIGAANRRRGLRPASLSELFRIVFRRSPQKGPAIASPALACASC